MTRWVIESTPVVWRVARLAALAIGLAVLESGIPSPLPGVKPGLANIVVLLVMVNEPPPPAEPKVPLVFTVPAPEPVMAAPPAMIFQV